MGMVHTFEMHGLKLALDVESGALHVLDGPGFLAVEKLAQGLAVDDVQKEAASEFGEETARQVMAEICELQEKGLLFSEPREVDLSSDGVVKALCLHLAHDCNLRCKYCFAGEGHYGGNRGLMPLETAKKAVDFLLEKSKGRKHVEIDFFGGEPLLNFQVLKDTVEYGKARAQEMGKVLKFTVTTNALRMPGEVLEYLNREGMSIVLSLDGREEVHDRMRVLPGGGKSWQRVLENCKAVVKGRGGDNYYLRGTYTRHNLDFSKDIDVMIEEGFDRISLEPAVLSPEAAEALQSEDVPVLEKEYEKLAQKLWQREEQGEKVFFFHFELDLHQGPCAKKRAQGCGAGAAYLAVTPEGSLYPCHQFAGDEDFCCGHVDSGVKDGLLTRFAAVDSANKEACRDCFARFFCGGGCHAAAWSMNQDMEKPYELGCTLHRKRVECGLYLQAKRMLASIG
ncbi:thioether cross-link-forming SCIFF peptide maturase [Dethiobacter alkaliphilus]|nr:thioether cross-link-forming SCIFF peptide maturase [Dethiobacter alkaliphilus]